MKFIYFAFLPVALNVGCGRVDAAGVRRWAGGGVINHAQAKSDPTFLVQGLVPCWYCSSHVLRVLGMPDQKVPVASQSCIADVRAYANAYVPESIVTTWRQKDCVADGLPPLEKTANFTSEKRQKGRQTLHHQSVLRSQRNSSGVPMPHRRNADSEAAERLRGSAERREIEIEEIEQSGRRLRLIGAVATNQRFAIPRRATLRH